MPEEFEDEKTQPEEEQDYSGPVKMTLFFEFRNERSKEIRCTYQTPHDAQRTIQIVNQAKQNSVPSNTIMLNNDEGDVFIIDMDEVQATTIKVRAN